jgi:hypothetical protein
MSLVLARIVVTITAIATLGGGHRAWAQGEDRPARAKKLCATGHTEEGVELLAALFIETGDVNYVYNQGRCYQQNGVADKAINRFREYLRRSPALPEAERREVEGFISELQGDLDRRQAATDSSEGSSRLRTIGLALGAAGAVAVGAGVILSVRVKSWTHEVEDRLAKRPDVSNQELSGWMRTGGRLETFQWVAYGVGAAALAGGATCYLLGYRRQREVAWVVAPAPGGVQGAVTVRF